MATTKTTTELLHGLRDPADGVAWSLFNERYRPIVLNYACRRGLQPADADDVAQETMGEFLRAYRAGSYDRTRGARLRDWLKGIAANRVREFVRRQARGKERQITSTDSQTDFMARLADDERQDSWEQEWRQHLLTLCLKAVRFEFDTKTLRAFEEYAVRQRPVEQVVRELEMSRNAVYIAKTRVLERMRELAHDFDSATGAVV
jgi:RNA polymerase sigma-70 factor (ECF subfamily)